MSFLEDMDTMFNSVDAEMKNISKEIADSLLIELKKAIRSGMGVSSDTAETTTAQALKPLSESYKKKRVKMGLGTKSNLTLTGEMINDITYEIRENNIRFFFKSSESNDKAVWNSDSRPFFNFTSQQMDQAHKLLDKLIQKFLDQKIKDSTLILK